MTATTLLLSIAIMVAVVIVAWGVSHAIFAAIDRRHAAQATTAMMPIIAPPYCR